MSQHAALLGSSSVDLRTTRAPQPVHFERKTGTYKFSLITYQQHQGDIPVYGSEVTVLVRNETDFPVVLVGSRTKALGQFAPALRGRTLTSAEATREANAAIARPDFTASASARARANFSHFTQAEAVIWAGDENQPAPPVLAVSYVAEYPGTGRDAPQRWRFVADAVTGTILHAEDLIVFDVTGNVHGFGTAGDRSPECTPAVNLPLAYAEVKGEDGSDAFADANGAYSLATTATGQLGITSKITGKYFTVADQVATRSASLTSSVTPPATQDFLQDPTGADEFLRAQVNGYNDSNAVHDWLLAHHPAYPVIATQTAFPVLVNRTDGYCPGNAWYDGASLNFCTGSSEYGNTAFASVDHHEYGHHIISSGGSGQGAYGEGMADTIAMLMVDDPGLGFGFYAGQCDTSLRTGNNTCTYSASTCSSCGSESHSCGELLSGSVWSIRNQLKQTNPTDYLDILSNLTLNSILLHKGTAIDPQIPVDFLTLDDDDGNIDNGTPHRAQICAGFAAHGLACPDLKTGMVITAGTFAPKGDAGGPFTPNNSAYTVHNYGPSAITLAVTADAPWLSVQAPSGPLAVGADATVNVALSAAANALGIGSYTGTLQFVNVTNHVGDTTQSVPLQVGTPKLQYSWNMDHDPGWVAQGQWQYGVPTGQGTPGFADPTSGFTGSNVYGYNLAGDFPANLPETHLTTTAIDCSQLSKVSLHFKRWLCVEPSYYDHAYVRVSSDGTNWTTVWQNSTSGTSDTSWSPQEFDLSAYADGKSQVYVRWTMGTTDSVVQYCGWNIDDVEIWGLSAPKTCTKNADCDNGLFCDGSESCVAGACVKGTAPNCADAVNCTVDSCDETSHACKHATNDAACSDGLFCNGTETCNAVTGCVAGTPVQCADGISCTTDSCNESAKSCQHAANNALCSDGLFCDGSETCNPSTGCVAGTNPCAAGTSCNEQTDSCACVPQCSNKQCGDNGCGGTCGTCGSGQACNAGKCVASSSCNGIATWNQANWASYTVGTLVVYQGSLYQSKDKNWAWIAPTDRDGGLGWLKVGPC